MKYLSLDYGKARVGLALGDSETRIALGKGVLEGFTQNKLITKLKTIVDLEKIDRIVVGLPLNMEGEPTPMTEDVQLFVEKLRSHIEVPIQTFDERLTSQMADRLLKDVAPDKRQQDQVAAQIILQNYLDNLVTE